LGTDAKGKFYAHEEGHNGSFLMMEQHKRVTVEVLWDCGMWNIGSMKKCVTSISIKCKI